VAGGPSWSELEADPVLAASEPVKRRMLGTMFALSEGEADHLLALIQERNPELPLGNRWGEAIGQLTRVTFHPSYT
jgi:5-methylcytosine-specific restriction protein B